MALSTYAQLKAAVADWLDRRDLGDRIADFITLAESRLNRLVRLRAMEVEVVLSARPGLDRLDLPADCLEPLALWREADGRREPLTFSAVLPAARADQAGEPSHWSLTAGQICLDRPFEAEAALGLRMRRAIRLSETEPSNPVLATCPDLYLFGTLMEAAPFLRDSDLLGLFAARYGAALAEANALEARPLGLSRLRAEAGLSC